MKCLSIQKERDGDRLSECSRERERKADRDYEKEREGDYFRSGREGAARRWRKKV